MIKIKVILLTESSHHVVIIYTRYKQLFIVNSERVPEHFGPIGCSPVQIQSTVSSYLAFLNRINAMTITNSESSKLISKEFFKILFLVRTKKEKVLKRQKLRERQRRWAAGGRRSSGRRRSSTKNLLQTKEQ